MADNPLTFIDDWELDSIQVHNVFHLEDISYADSVVFYDPGAMGENTGGEPDPVFQKPQAALGSPDFKCVGLGNGGNLIVKLNDNVLINGPGPDLYIYQTDTTNEEILVWISNDGEIYRFAGKTSIDSPYVDIEKVADVGEFYNYIKVRDNSYQGKQSGSDLGANIDAISAIHTAYRIIFSTDSLFTGENITLREKGYQYISDMARLIKHYEKIQIKIFVHSHQIGTSYFNQIISQQRASAIKTYLIDQNLFDENTVQAYGMGNKYPIIKKSAGKPISKNRRIEIFVHPEHLKFPIKRR